MFSTNNKENSTSLLKVIAVFSLMILCVTTTNTTNAQTNGSTYLDFTGDGKTDWTVIAPVQTQGQRYTLKILGNQTGSAPSQPFIRIFDFGLAGIDVIYAADYIGDRKTDLTAYRRGQPSIFYTAQFPIGTGGIQLERAVRWGAETDGSVQGDYDGDGKMDYTVVRRNANNALTWFILSSSTNVMRTVTFGNASLNSAVIGGADFTGDSKDELIIISDVNGKFVYYIGDAVTGAWLLTFQWGLAGNFADDYLQPADYTGDGKADLIAVRRNVNPMVWYILDPARNASTATMWGFGLVNAGDRPDTPIRGDYDGDGRQDIAVYRQSNQTFYVLRSSDGSFIVQPWGTSGDLPLRVPHFSIFID